MWQKVTYDLGDGEEYNWTTSINDIDVIWDGISQFEFYTDIENGDPQTLELGEDHNITSKKKLYKIAKDFIEDMRGELL